MSFGNIIGELLQQGMGGQSRERLQRAADRSGGGLDAMLGSLLGGNAPAGQRGHQAAGGPGGAAGGLGGLGDLGRMAQDYLGSRQAGGMTGAQVGGLGALVGAVLGGGGGALRGAAGGGIMAILGSLALTALKNYQSGAAGAPSQQAAPPPVTEDEVAEVTDPRTERLVLRAMIEAAKCDGKIDQDEMQRIVGKIEPGSVTPEERRFVIDEMSRPADPGGLAREVQSPAVAAQIYAASLLAIHIDTEAERTYLRNLATALGLEPGTVQRLHQMTGVPAA